LLSFEISTPNLLRVFEVVGAGDKAYLAFLNVATEIRLRENDWLKINFRTKHQRSEEDWSFRVLAPSPLQLQGEVTGYLYRPFVELPKTATTMKQGISLDY